MLFYQISCSLINLFIYSLYCQKRERRVLSLTSRKELSYLFSSCSKIFDLSLQVTSNTSLELSIGVSESSRLHMTRLYSATIYIYINISYIFISTGILSRHVCLFPYFLCRHGRRTRTFNSAWWSHLGPINLAHGFVV